MMRLTWPLPAANHKVTSTHGPTGNDGKPHIGIDISAEVNTPVYAAHAGVVRYEWTPLGGNCVRLLGDTHYTRYCHLQGYTADDGEQVRQGDEIARSGNTGSATTGAHLHFEVHLPSGVAIDPLSLMEVPVLGKLAIHFQTVPDWAGALTARYWPLPGGWVKAITPPIPDAFPQTHVLGRLWIRNDMNTWEHDCARRGHEGGEEYFAACLPHYQERKGMVTAWEAVNEPDLTTPPAAYAYRDFLNSWCAKMHAAGFKTCGGSIPVGNPQLQVFGDPMGNQVVAIIAPALAQCDYWSYHAYWDGRFNPKDNWWAFRYREIVAAAKVTGITLPPLIISECGCDRGGGKMDGWRARMGWAEHFADLQAFDAEIGKDAYVVAATLFTGGPNSDWVYFEYDQSQVEAIGKLRVGEPVPAPVHEGLPTDETATDAKTLAEKCRWWLQEYARQVEAGNTGYATRILYALITLHERLEAAQKAGR
jgi:hypothetical protein